MYMCIYICMYMYIEVRGKCWAFSSVAFQLSLNSVHKSVSLTAQRTLGMLLPPWLPDVRMPGFSWGCWDAHTHAFWSWLKHLPILQASELSFDISILCNFFRCSCVLMHKWIIMKSMSESATHVFKLVLGCSYFPLSPKWWETLKMLSRQDERQ